jgi:hypothetical protein
MQLASGPSSGWKRSQPKQWNRSLNQSPGFDSRDGQVTAKLFQPFSHTAYASARHDWKGTDGRVDLYALAEIADSDNDPIWLLVNLDTGIRAARVTVDIGHTFLNDPKDGSLDLLGEPGKCGGRGLYGNVQFTSLHEAFNEPVNRRH